MCMEKKHLCKMLSYGHCPRVSGAYQVMVKIVEFIQKASTFWSMSVFWCGNVGDGAHITHDNVGQNSMSLLIHTTTSLRRWGLIGLHIYQPNVIWALNLKHIFPVGFWNGNLWIHIDQSQNKHRSLSIFNIISDYIQSCA